MPVDREQQSIAIVHFVSEPTPGVDFIGSQNDVRGHYAIKHPLYKKSIEKIFFIIPTAC